MFGLALGTFGIGTGEFSIMGLLPNVAHGLRISVPQAGDLIGAYALGVVVGAPLFAILVSRLSRRGQLLLLLSWFALGNLASMLAPNYATLLLFRFLSGFPHGAYFGAAALLAASLAQPHQRGEAVGRVILGLTIASLFGNPLATWLGQEMNWRYAFGSVAAIAVATLVWLHIFLPRRDDHSASSPMRELGALGNARVWLTLGIGAIGFGGMFAVISYVAPVLTTLAQMPPAWLPFALAAFGGGMIAGNLAGGWAADRALMPSIGAILVWDILVLLVFPFSLNHVLTAFVGTFLIGSNMALVAPLQLRLMDVAADAQTLAASLNHSAFNLANALGAFLGGWVISSRHGLQDTAYFGALLPLGGLLLFAYAYLHERRVHARRAA
ncbi:MFS transporter [Burkholderia sp. WAC0059]|nr:MFS transporter [Burkholderia sp. WAC0059]